MSGRGSWLAIVGAALACVGCGQGVGEQPLGGADAGAVSAPAASPAGAQGKTLSDAPASLRQR